MIRCLQGIVNVQTVCFVIMPDHVHWLLQLLDGANLSKVVHKIKSSSAQKLNIEINRRGRFWQPGFHDHAIRSHQSLREIARYIVANPLRAGIVRHVGSYPHWDAMWL